MSQKVLVAGTGISGIAAAKLLLSKGGIFFTEDKADNIHCVKTSGTGKTAKTGRYRSNDDRY